MENTVTLSQKKPYGLINKVAKRLGVSHRTVQNTLNGESKNPKILVAVADLLEEESQLEKSAIERINKILTA